MFCSREDLSVWIATCSKESCCITPLQSVLPEMLEPDVWSLVALCSDWIRPILSFGVQPCAFSTHINPQCPAFVVDMLSHLLVLLRLLEHPNIFHVSVHIKIRLLPRCSAQQNTQHFSNSFACHPYTTPQQ